MEDKEREGKSKKDIIYWFIIFDLVIFLIGLIVFIVFNEVTDPKIIIDLISFSSSVASILLAIVAIIYAFLQTNESSRHNTIIKANIDKLDSKMSEFISIKQDFETFRTSDLVSMNEKIADISDAIKALEQKAEIDLSEIDILTTDHIKNPDTEELRAKIKGYQDELKTELRQLEDKVLDLKSNNKKKFNFRYDIFITTNRELTYDETSNMPLNIYNILGVSSYSLNGIGSRGLKISVFTREAILLTKIHKCVEHLESINYVTNVKVNTFELN
jgi:hypothetical protein